MICLGTLAALASPASHAGTVPSICDAVAGNLVNNCGFETGDFTGWSLAGNDVTAGLLGNLYGVEGTDPIVGTLPNSGNSQAYFSDIVSNATTLSQTLATVAGTTYTVSFELAQQLEGPGTVNNSVVASFGGATLATLTNVAVQGYTLYTYTATAGSASSLLSLTFGNDIGEFLLDDVTVTAQAPLPAAGWLLLSALPLVGAMTRRRNRRVA
jgi:hypothetical protein